MNEKERALLPCPFCGSTAVLLTMNDRFSAHIRCGFCFCAGSAKTDASEAIAAWNARAFAHPTSATAGSALPAEREIEILRRALAWHGDQQRMATTREDWQQVIDAAIVWVMANPEEGYASFPTFAALASPDDITCAGSEGASLDRESVTDADVMHLAHILEDWDMKPTPNDWTGHSYEDIARDALTRLALLPARSEPVVDGAAEVRRLALEEAAEVAEVVAKECRADERKYQQDPDYAGAISMAAGGQMEARKIANRIRALATTPDHVGRVETGKGEGE